MRNEREGQVHRHGNGEQADRQLDLGHRPDSFRAAAAQVERLSLEYKVYLVLPPRTNLEKSDVSWLILIVA